MARLTGFRACALYALPGERVTVTADAANAVDAVPSLDEAKETLSPHRDFADFIRWNTGWGHVKSEPRQPSPLAPALPPYQRRAIRAIPEYRTAVPFARVVNGDEWKALHNPRNRNRKRVANPVLSISNHADLPGKTPLPETVMASIRRQVSAQVEAAKAAGMPSRQRDRMAKDLFAFLRSRAEADALREKRKRTAKKAGETRSAHKATQCRAHGEHSTEASPEHFPTAYHTPNKADRRERGALGNGPAVKVRKKVVDNG